MANGNASILALSHTLVCVALGAALVLLFGADSSTNTAVSQVMDAGAQRLRMQEELVRLNGKMDELLLLLRSGNVKVICLPADTDNRGQKHGWNADPILAPCNGPAPAGSHAR